MKVVNVHEAKSSLSALLAQAEAGEDVVIARNGVPVVRLVRVERQQQRVPGSWRKLPGWENFQYDPSLLAPMDDREMEAEGWP